MKPDTRPHITVRITLRPDGSCHVAVRIHLALYE